MSSGTRGNNVKGCQGLFDGFHMGLFLVKRFALKVVPGKKPKGGLTLEEIERRRWAFWGPH